MRAFALGLALVASPVLARGAAGTGRYPDLFRRADPAVDARAVAAKLDRYWRALFEGGAEERVYYPAAATPDGPAAYILDVGNGDVRSEGMSYGLMIAVQMDRKPAFDALWNWAATHMRYRSGPRAGYFRWQCQPAGCDTDSVPASDGEEYIATALLMAAARWGDGEGLYAYRRQAQALLDTMLHTQDRNGGVVAGVTDMFDGKADQVVFVPVGDSARFTDPSYHLPAFYELWARQARTAADRARWRRIAATSRRYFTRAADARTGLTPDYASFAGRAVPIEGHGDFRYDAFRTAANWSVDQAWWGRNPAAGLSDRLQGFFATKGDSYPALHRLDGTMIPSEPSAALVASNAVASLAGGRWRPQFVRRLWALEPPRGRWRYYDGLVQFLAVLHVSGRFRAYGAVPKPSFPRRREFMPRRSDGFLPARE